MENQEIKNECDSIHDQIEKAKERLKYLRSICKHENTFDGNYSYRTGSISPAKICSDCGELIEIY